MESLPHTPELLAVARRVVWFKEPRDALADTRHFIAHVMTYGTVEDLQKLSSVVADDAFGEVLDAPPPGVFDPRSWAYWHVKLNRVPPPLPDRVFG